MGGYALTDIYSSDTIHGLRAAHSIIWDNLYHHFYRADAPHKISHQPIMIRLGIMYILVTYEWHG